ncbi:protein-L-isoaspartate(D-aspartate) O-methyltransferase [Candidatus Thioglobus sp.]|uniref:protein-L-isoaspartate(D-aspartate) O-methyltransferase n=1 Tax=Candidatus Thioglobus sp. TaxID=2026721 RepID=UPI00175782F7|nr:protein-L-isoaspartate(D-aspartate) O-methyltransferase [Candidatus Thioglobus sp.]HIF47363.1 protein-L-isoaspartate(D-aspartate) O-methyltransferase [Candidatus Thioglobus sp.]
MNKATLFKKLQKDKLIKDHKVLKAFQAISREMFVLKDSIDQAYYDGPLRIGYEQTISQPTTVLMMVEALELKKTDKVLEVGSGSGYAAAILSQLSHQVYSVEIVPELVVFTKKNLTKAKIKNVEVIQWDGGLGYDKQAPYDKIIVSAACDKIPEALIDQLVEGGILIAPVGATYPQQMIKGVKHNKKLEKIYMGDYAFVPLTGKFGKA